MTTYSHSLQNPGDESAHERFQGISEAYEVLVDPNEVSSLGFPSTKPAALTCSPLQRAAYDNYGRDGMKQQGAGTAGFDADDLFEQMFGGGMGGFSFDPFEAEMNERRGPKKPRTPKNTEVDYEIDLETAYLGETKTWGITRDRACGHCKT